MQLAGMSFDEILDLTADVFKFYKYPEAVRLEFPRNFSTFASCV